ncbi:DUF6491 family protein [Phenylobacterium sp.]|uniref:DUF6491 family protein n=1 Tax=Phenylobacterium sp. TaxID=1871053 RepID=UPI0035B39F7D
MKLIALSTILAAALAAGQPASEPAAQAETSAAVDASATASADGCFRMSQIRSHRIASEDTVYLKVGFKDVYRVTMAGACGAGAMRDDTLILSTAASTDLICHPLDLDLKIRSSTGFVTPCIVSSIARLSDEQVAAIPAKLRP